MTPSDSPDVQIQPDLRRHSRAESTNLPGFTGGRPGAATLFLYAFMIFMGAALLFVVQPLSARILLPSFGGSASVWNTALVVFQTLLLAGYGFAHLVQRLPSRSRRFIQFAVIAAPLITLTTRTVEARGGSPVVSVVLSIVVAVGAPYFALATLSPTLQRWFASSSHRLASNPYPLYSASNAGSLLGLLGYPLLIEPQLTVENQRLGFAVLYGLLVVLVGAVALAGLRRQDSSASVPAASNPVLGGVKRLPIVGLAFVPTFLLLGVTRHLSTDVASFPLLWVVPLSIYLVTFVLGFSGGFDRLSKSAGILLRVLVIPAILMSGTALTSLWLSVSIPLVLIGATGLVAHRRLYDLRPPVADLTAFYLWVSAGGALGGAAAALAAPLLFDSVMEYPIAVVLAAVLAAGPLRIRSNRWAIAGFIVALLAALFVPTERLTLLLAAVAAVVAFVFAGRAITYAAAIAAVASAGILAADTTVIIQERTFYGVYRVLDTGTAHELFSGTTSHGAQLLSTDIGTSPTTGYYHTSGPAGSVFRWLGSRDRSYDAGIVGLGAGELAAFGRAGDTITFYEIDQAVVDIASDPTLFTYLQDSPASAEVHVGDGRLLLEDLRPRHDLLVVDAFSSDSIPVHLLTREAFETYKSVIGPQGILLLHISNRYMTLEGVVGAAAAEMGMDARIVYFSPDAVDTTAKPSTWVVMSPRKLPADLLATQDWRVPVDVGPLWTDDYSNIVGVINWN